MDLNAITPERLRSLTGNGYERGERYWRQGRVVEWSREGDTLRGIVLGTRAYSVSVAWRDGRLTSACTCPMGYLCKHAVALVLQERAASDPAARPAVADAFATRADLVAFATQHEILHVLDVAGSVLAERLPLGPKDPWRRLLAQMAVRQLGSLELAARYARSRGLDVEIARAAYRLLHEAAEAVRGGIAEERAERPAPDDRALAPLWHKLIELRAVVRASAAPRARASRPGTWTLDPRARAIEWCEPVKIAHPVGTGMVACVTRLEFPDGEHARLECTCRPRAACTHALALIDATLDRLADPERADARSLAEHLLAPPWARALAELDAVATPAEIEVWWEIEPDGYVQLRPLVKRRNARGWSRGSRMAAPRLLEAHGEALDDRDRAIAEALEVWEPSDRQSYPARAFAALAGHPRVVFEGSEDRAEVARATLGFSAVDAGEAIRLEPTVPGEHVSPRLLGALLDAFRPGEPLLIVEAEDRRCLVVDVPDDARRLWTAIARHGDAFPPEAHGPLLDRLARIEARVPIALSRSLKGAQLAARPVTVVRLRLLADASITRLELELFVRPAPGAPLFPPGAGPRDVLMVQAGQRGYVRRVLEDELAMARTALAQLPLEGAEEGPPQCWQLTDPDAALAVVAAVQDPPPGLEAEWVDERPVIRRASSAEGLRVRIDQKRDWFGISGDLTYEGGRLELAAVLDAVRRQQRYVRVDANRWIELSDALRQQLVPVADRVFAAGERLELSPGAVPAIRTLAEVGARVDAVEPWQRLTERLAAARALRPRPPASLKAKLRDYQVAGHAWLARVAAWGGGAVLADDMGLGKTVQAIAVLLDRAKLGPALVLAPTSVGFNWVDELRRFAPSLRPVVYGTAPDRAAAIAALGKRDVLIVSYGLLARDAALLADRTFATLIADEAQALKNPATRRVKAARLLRAELRIALSGTPFENHLGELWSLYSVVFPGLLGSWERFRARFGVPIERNRDARAREALSRVLRPFLLRRTKHEVAKELPPRTEIDVPVALSDPERTIYEDARLAAIAELSRKGQGVRDERRRFQVLAAITRLRLIACHPKLHDPTSKVVSSKLARALELLEELREAGHRALVFSQFTSHLALVREALGDAGFRTLYLDGATPARDRERLVRAFQDGEGEAFLISLKAGGQGINLTAADYVIHLDPWWNPAVEDQATDRAHRIGQDKPVTVYRLIARDTIEDQIRSLHETKRALVAGVLEGSDAAARLTTKDLLALLAAR